MLPAARATPDQDDLVSILLGCLHTDAGRPDAVALACLGATDWERLGDLAAQGKVEFQLYERLMQPRLRPSVAPPLLDRLRASAQAQALKELGLRATLVEILRACAIASLPVMTLKGMHLAHTVYNSASARGMADIDLLFRRSDMARATAVFKSLGYHVPHDASNLIDLAPANHEYALLHPRFGATVDVHWALTDPRMEAAIDEAAFWHRACAVTIGAESALGLAREDLIAYLCFHASHHHYFGTVGLRPFVDVARLCAGPSPPDWAILAERTRAWGWGRGVYLTLSMVRRYLGAAIPEQALGGIADAPADLDQMHAAALASIFFDTGSRNRVERNVLRLWTNGSNRERLGLLAHRLFPPRIELVEEFGLTEAQALPPAFWLHVRRIGRLFRRHGPKVWNIWRGDSARLAELTSQRVLIEWLDSTDHG